MDAHLHPGVADRLLLEELALLVDLLLVDEAALRNLSRAALGHLVAHVADAVRLVRLGARLERTLWASVEGVAVLVDQARVAGDDVGEPLHLPIT